jgi:hypothetical protein
MPIPAKGDLRRFCEIDGWQETNAVSPDHDRYRKKLDNGDILRTKVSRGRGPVCDDPALWHRIWREQLGLESEDVFWEVLRSRKPARRGQPESGPEGEALDTWLFEFLVNVVGMSETDVLELSADDAMELYLRYVSGQNT